MRALIISLAMICAFSISTSAQESSNESKNKSKKNTIRYGFGSTFHSNEMVGNFQYGEYTRYLGRRFALSALGGYLKADNFGEENLPTLFEFNAWKGDLNLFVLPINNDNTSLKIGGGASYWMGDFKSRDTSEVEFTTTEAEDYGWNVVAEFEVYLSNTVVLGTRGAYTKAQNGENYYFFGLNAGLKF